MDDLSTNEEELKQYFGEIFARIDRLERAIMQIVPRDLMEQLASGQSEIQHIRNWQDSRLSRPKLAESVAQASEVIDNPKEFYRKNNGE